jgi:hypothetical protein
VDAHGPPRDSETWDDFPFDGRRLLLRNFQVGGGLQIQPQLSGCLELVRQAHGRIGGDRAPTVNDQADAAQENPGISRQPYEADA